MKVPRKLRKSVLEAARTGSATEIDTALRAVDAQYIDGLRKLATTPGWRGLIGAKVELLMDRVNVRSEALGAIAISPEGGSLDGLTLFQLLEVLRVRMSLLYHQLLDQIVEQEQLLVLHH